MAAATLAVTRPTYEKSLNLPSCTGKPVAVRVAAPKKTGFAPKPNSAAVPRQLSPEPLLVLSQHGQ